MDSDHIVSSEDQQMFLFFSKMINLYHVYGNREHLGPRVDPGGEGGGGGQGCRPHWKITSGIGIHRNKH